MSMRRAFTSFGCAGILLTAAASAAPHLSSSRQIEPIPIQGITLAMTPNEAFDQLSAAGFRAGSIQSYADWDSDGVAFVRGTYGSRSGYWSVVFTRLGVRVTRISETFNAPGKQLDAEGEIGSAKRHLGITQDTQKCKAASATTGVCGVQDAEANVDAETTYTLQILPGMRMSTASRTKELSAE